MEASAGIAMATTELGGRGQHRRSGCAARRGIPTACAAGVRGAPTAYAAGVRGIPTAGVAARKKQFLFF
jgi:hypothetical protein